MKDNKIAFITLIIATITLIVTSIGVIVAILIAMFPTLFPSIGVFLIKLKPYVWIIIIMLLIIAGQQVFIYTKLQKNKSVFK